MWMGPSAFQYYLRAAICYLQSEAANDDADMISQLATTFEFQLECHPKDLAPIAAELANDCKYILENYDRLGDLPKSETEMQERIEIMRKVLSGLGHNLNRKPEDYVDLRPRFEELLKKFLSLAEAK